MCLVGRLTLLNPQSSFCDVSAEGDEQQVVLGGTQERSTVGGRGMHRDPDLPALHDWH